MDEEAEVIDFSKVPLAERCSHKNWRARVSAYEELINTFSRIDDERSPEWNKYSALVRKFPSDTNAAAQEKGLEATLLFLENSALAGKIVSEVMSSVLAKGLISPKQKSKELCSDILLMCIEIEKYEVVQDEFIKSTESKNPKVVAAAIGLITHGLRNFGPNVFNLKVLMKKVLVLLEDRDKCIRGETKKLVVEFYRWLGPGFKAHLTGIKPLIQTELETEVEKFGNEKPVQIRFLRSQLARKDKPVQNGNDGEEENFPIEESPPEIDPYDLLDPVDILSMLPKELYPRTESPKWSDRKEVLEELLVLASNPKLEAGDYADMVRMLKKIISRDINVLVVAVAGKCLAGLANGLKKKFSPFAPSCLSATLEKFKEKKVCVLTSMRDASDACFQSSSLEAVQEEVLGALGSKNPTVKLETCSFLARGFSKTPNKFMTDKKLMKPYLTALVLNLNESDKNVRDAAAEALGVAMKAMGEKAIQPYLQDVEAARVQKVKDLAEIAVVLAPKASPAKLLPPKTAPPKTKTPSSANGPFKVPKTSAKKLIGVAARRPPMTAVPQQVKVEEFAFPQTDHSGPSSPTATADGGPIDLSFILTPQIIEGLSDKSWKIREEHLDKVSRMIVNKSIQSNLNDFPQALSQRLQDKNRNIALSAIVLSGNLATALGPNAKHHIRTMLPSILACLCDSKTIVRSTVIACMNAWAEAAGMDKFFQGEYLYEALKSNNPFLRCELFNWLAIRLPAVKNIYKEDLNICVPLLYASLEDRNADVRRSAQEVLSAFMLHLGYDSMYKAASKLKPASKIAVFAMLEKHRHAVPEMQAKLKSGTLRNSPVKNSALTNGNARGDWAQVKPGTALPVVKSPVYSDGMKIPSAKCAPKCVKSLGSGGKDLLDLQGQTAPFDDALSSDNSQPPSARYGGGGDGNSGPTKFQLDLEAVEKMFVSALGLGSESIPPVQLHETNSDFLSNDAPIELPLRRSQTRGHPALGELRVPSRSTQSIDLVVGQLESSEYKVCMESIATLDKLLADLEVANVMSTRVDQMFSMICSQMRKSLPLLQSSTPDKLKELNDLFSGMMNLIQTLYKGSLLPLRATKDLLRDLVFQLLSLLCHPQITSLPDSEAIVKHANILVCRIIEKSDPNEIFCGLVRLLNENLLKYSSNTRLMELTYKCLWKWLKQFNMWADDKDYHFDIDAFLREFFAFMNAHHITSFANRDITPLRTMKTILYSMVSKLGAENMEAALVRIPDYNSSEAGQYICKVIRKEIKSRSDSTETDAQNCPQQSTNNKVEGPTLVAEASGGTSKDAHLFH